jgi:hypothetical protein
MSSLCVVAQVIPVSTTPSKPDVKPHHEEVTKKEESVVLDKELKQLAEKEKEQQNKYKEAPEVTMSSNGPDISSSLKATTVNPTGATVKKRKKSLESTNEPKMVVVVPPSALPKTKKAKKSTEDELPQ